MSPATVDCAAVDFDLSGDQQALRDAAASLLDKMAGSDALRARVGPGAIVGTLPGAGAASGQAAVDAPTGYDQAVWSAMADQGWLAIELPEDDGGLGLGMVELAVLCEEIGRRLVAAPFLPTIVPITSNWVGSPPRITARCPAAGMVIESRREDDADGS